MNDITTFKKGTYLRRRDRKFDALIWKLLSDYNPLEGGSAPAEVLYPPYHRGSVIEVHNLHELEEVDSLEVIIARLSE
jgi:hypothetical protein